MPEDGGATFQRSTAIMLLTFHYLIFPFSELISTLQHLGKGWALWQSICVLQLPEPACRVCGAHRSLECPGTQGWASPPMGTRWGTQCLARSRERRQGKVQTHGESRKEGDAGKEEGKCWPSASWWQPAVALTEHDVTWRTIQPTKQLKNLSLGSTVPSLSAQEDLKGRRPTNS